MKDLIVEIIAWGQVNIHEDVNLAVIAIGVIFGVIISYTKDVFSAIFNFFQQIGKEDSFSGVWHTYRISRTRDASEGPKFVQIYERWEASKAIFRTGYILTCFDEKNKIDYKGIIKPPDGDYFYFRRKRLSGNEDVYMIMQNPDPRVDYFVALSLSRNYMKFPHATAYFGSRVKHEKEEGIRLLRNTMLNTGFNSVITLND